MQLSQNGSWAGEKRLAEYGKNSQSNSHDNSDASIHTLLILFSFDATQLQPILSSSEKHKKQHKNFNKIQLIRLKQITKIKTNFKIIARWQFPKHIKNIEHHKQKSSINPRLQKSALKAFHNAIKVGSIKILV